jgi:hypothetical protein
MRQLLHTCNYAWDAVCHGIRHMHWHGMLHARNAHGSLRGVCDFLSDHTVRPVRLAKLGAMHGAWKVATRLRPTNMALRSRPVGKSWRKTVRAVSSSSAPPAELWPGQKARYVIGQTDHSGRRSRFRCKIRLHSSGMPCLRQV